MTRTEQHEQHFRGRAAWAQGQGREEVDWVLGVGGRGPGVWWLRRACYLDN